jgi:hypothetical protein
MLILASPNAGALGAFTDDFDSTLNARYAQTSGTWTVTGGDASTSTAAASYPLLSFNANTQEVTVKAEGGTTNQFGWGVAFWVTDSNNWWAVISDREEFQTQTGTITVCNACGDGGISTGPPSCDCVYCSCVDCPGNPSCGQTINAGGTTQPVYRTDYRYVIRLLKRESGTVTTVASATISEGNIGSTLTIAYVQAVMNTAGQITATGQMSTGGTVATITNTPVTPTKSRRHGIIVAPKTTGTQSSTIEKLIYSPA